MSVKFHRTEIVTKNVRQLAYGGMLILERRFSQKVVLQKVVVDHCIDSPTAQ